MAIIPGVQKSVSPLGLIQKNKQKSQLLLLVLLVVTAIAVYIVFSGRLEFLTPTVAPPTDAENFNSALASQIKDLELDVSELADSDFKLLKTHGVFPIVIGEKGRPNPFEPF